MTACVPSLDAVMHALLGDQSALVELRAAVGSGVNPCEQRFATEVIEASVRFTLIGMESAPEKTKSLMERYARFTTAMNWNADKYVEALQTLHAGLLDLDPGCDMTTLFAPILEQQNRLPMAERLSRLRQQEARGISFAARIPAL
jgi:hypothetical protein